jgi:predicted ABC-type transport system involved in lysophospholipase L1 biosynthesis ATPase subunit
MLARALNGHPRMLLADESTVDFDGETARVVTDAPLEFASAGGTLIVATTTRP